MAGWIVKSDGPCSKCGTVLRAGEPAVYDWPRRKMSCVECPTAAPLGPSPPPPIDAGVAGGSARREHDRLATKREQKIDERWGRLSGVVKALTFEPQSTRAWAIGAAGEEDLARSLSEVPGLQVLNDRRVRGTNGNIDHIVIAPAGVFVIDAKNVRGTIEIRNAGYFWQKDYRLFVGRRDKTSYIEGFDWQIAAVKTALEVGGIEPLPSITPVLCFINGDWPLFSAPERHGDVRIEGPRSIKKLLTASTVLDTDGIDRIARVLAAQLPAKQGAAT